MELNQLCEPKVTNPSETAKSPTISHNLVEHNTESVDVSIAQVAAIFKTIQTLSSDKRPEHLAEVISQLSPLLESLRRIISGELNDILSHYKNESIENIDDKKRIASDLNALLGSVGLQFRCPNTQKPARLHVRTGKDAKQGQFQFDIKDKITCSFSSIRNLPIQLMLTEPDKRYRFKTQPEADTEHRGFTR